MGVATWLSLLLAASAGPEDAVTASPSAAAVHGPVEVELGGATFIVVPTAAFVPRGDVVTYRVLVERRHADDAAAFAMEVDGILADPAGWSAAGYLFAPVQGAADLTIVLASRGVTDRLCAPLRTGGAYSCGRNGRAVINAARFRGGAATYRGQLAAYRTYVINHEIGHLLGFDHRACPGRGAAAPVMLPQTKSLDGCRRRAVPRDDEIAALAARPPRYLRARPEVPIGPVRDAVAAAASHRPEGRGPVCAAP